MEFTREGLADDIVPFDSLRNSVKGRAGNGIRFDSTETMFIADYKGHNILRYNMKWVSHSSFYIVKLSLVCVFVGRWLRRWTDFEMTSNAEAWFGKNLNFDPGQIAATCAKCIFSSLVSLRVNQIEDLRRIIGFRTQFRNEST